MKDEDRRRLDDSILHATIVRQDEPTDDESSIYYLFERLNSGGTRLQPQEIRACIFHGTFNDLLHELNRNESWRSVFGRRTNSRLRDQELILRFLALYYYSDHYERPMKEFLNTYMGKNSNVTADSVAKLRALFTNTISTVYQCLGAKAFKPKGVLNAAVFDSVMVGIARRLDKGKTVQCDTLNRQYTALLSKEEFINATETATSDEENVIRRLSLATEAFADGN